MLKFEKEESDNDSDKAISKSVTNTPIKNRTDSNLNASNDDAHVNNVNNVIPNAAAVPNKVSMISDYFNFCALDNF